MKIRHQNDRQCVVVQITLQWICSRLLGTSRCNYRSQSLSRYAVADPGFPRGGCANSPGGHQHTILPKFPKNYMKLK